MCCKMEILYILNYFKIYNTQHILTYSFNIFFIK